MKSDWLEPVAAVACALASFVAPIDGGATAALVGGAALLARFKAARAKAGLDDAKLTEKMRLAVIRDWDRPDQSEEARDAVGLAATAMGKHIADCLPTREQVAQVAMRGQGSYPAAVARLVVDRLAGCDAECGSLFVAPGDGAEPSIGRRFALDVVERAVRQAKDDPEYATLLTLDLVIEIAGGVARVEDMVEANSAVCLDTNAMVRALFDDMRATQRARHLTDEALIALARRIAAKVEDAGEALEALGLAIDEFIRQRDQAERGTNLGELVDRTLRNIVAANDLGDLDKGAQEAARAFDDWCEQLEAARQAGLRLIDANIEQHRLRFDAEAMAHWIGKRLKLENGGTLDFEALRVEQDRWYVLGRDHGLSLELDVSIRLARLSERIAKSETDRAIAQNDLGIALATRGARTGGDAGSALLSEAVSAFRAALTVRTERAMPADWAGTQNSLGAALQTQAERTGGDAGLALLAEAVSAYRAALTVYTERAMPADWAMTLNNLGFALARQGERTGGDAGLALLADAVSAYRVALTVRTERAMPVDWAGTQNNLGTALTTQGGRTGGDAGLALLADAVSAYRAALSVFTERAMSANWAMTQNNLGTALETQGERTVGDAGLALLAEAVSAYHAALRVWTAEHFGYQHEGATRNLARAFALIAERSK
ncbi:tetratricopeptide repeat protein [Sphingomonas hengshuiensis]|uniref:tetratricopeptide repeat protein n=1 Tax=Sphingomonas hengshuiensis TaxID=1609977 RepID=UPI000698C1D1|nr:tetratricopeptide repeat protein [Sphingomonas hengshuiensis]